MTNKVKTVAIILILLGTIGVSMVILFGTNTTTYLHKSIIEDTALTWYQFDFHSYVENLVTEVTDTTELQLQVPWRTWGDGLEYLSNNLALIMDYVILVINILLYPLKIGGYLLNFFLALCGINVDPTSSLNWLGVMSKALIGLTVPYI